MANESTSTSEVSHRPSTAELLRSGLSRSIHEPYDGAAPVRPTSSVRFDGPGYSGTQAAKVVGITYRQLDYFARTELIRPSIADDAGSGSRRRYSYTDLLELKAITKLLDAGIKLDQVRKVFAYIRENVTTDITAAHVVIDGGSVDLYDDGQLIDVLQNGQGVLNVLSFGGVKSELDARIADVGSESEQSLDRGVV